MTIIADQFQAKIFWQASQPLVAGRSYLFCRDNISITASITAIKYREHEKNGEHLPARNITANQIAVVNISIAEPISFSEHVDSAFSLRDISSLVELGKGTLEFNLHRATNIRWQTLTINKTVRASLKKQVPRCIWFTGLSGSGKSTVANLLEKRLFEQGFHTYLLDGDNLRHGLNRDLGFTEADRVENIRRVAEVARLMVDAGLIVLASFISPYRSERLAARKLFSENEFIEIFMDTPLHECERRDVKGLYAKARSGELKNFTGIDSAYERPEDSELTLHSYHTSAEESVEQVIQYLHV